MFDVRGHHSQRLPEALSVNVNAADTKNLYGVLLKVGVTEQNGLNVCLLKEMANKELIGHCLTS